MLRAVEVVIDRVAPGLDRPFTYLVDEATAQVGPGWRVVAPLGKSRAEGVVVADSVVEDGQGLKPLQALLGEEALIPQDLIDTAHYLRDRWCCYLPQALRAVIPAPVRRMADPESPCLYVGERPGSRAVRRQEIFRQVLEQPGVSVDLLETRGYRRDLVRAMIAAGELVRGPAPSEAIRASAHHLTPAQTEALDLVRRARVTGGEVLLEGVTGSGKTEIYLAAIEETIQAGRQAIMLVPEIALTPQTEARFLARFPGRVAIFHSAMADGERVRGWHRVRRGEATVVVGARSAVFAPCPNLGLVVMDEEHESTYKQDDHPRYHARDVARFRVEQTRGVLLLGTATPSMESAFRARTGRSYWARLPERVQSRPMPTVHIVDMREELRSGHREMFSRELKTRVSQVLQSREQTILFLNRRGYATSVVCRDCGVASRCPSCAVSLTLHQTERELVCHYCLHREAIPLVCPQCGSGRIRQFGVGTEQVVEEVHRQWPGARVMRADADSLRRRGSHESVFRRFSEGGADILVGTQMIAKGMDWPLVTLVGIVAADLTLTLPDFRAAERTFSLLTQAAGRAGRGSRPGHVVIQTYNPEHYSVEAASRQDFDRFYDQEIAYREALHYPPYGHLVLIEVTAATEQEAAARAELLGGRLRELAQTVGEESPLLVMGPAPAPLARLRNRYRQHILLKAGREQDALLSAQALLSHDPDISITVDPYHLL